MNDLKMCQECGQPIKDRVFLSQVDAFGEPINDYSYLHLTCINEEYIGMNYTVGIQENLEE